jgi:hydrogenase maturation factor
LNNERLRKPHKTRILSIGLLINAPAAQADALLAGLKDNGISHAAIIGEVTGAPEHITML